MNSEKFLMKSSALIGFVAGAIGVLIGSNLPKDIVKAPVSITTFNIRIPFDQWVLGFDSKEAEQMHKANNIKPIFRGVSVKDPKKVVVIHQSNSGSVEKFLSDNKKMIESTGHIMRTTRTSDWSFQ
tara:strand:+ start:757 stop:1134 length:378 start_codon:yes stop_codon:yes gene_type:complete